MSSPLTNLKKTSLASEKIIKNGLELRNTGPVPMEAEVYYVRRNSPELIDRENIILNMTNRLANLENEMMGVRHELSRAIEEINRKDAEIAMLKQKLLPQDNQPVHSSMPANNKLDNQIHEEFNCGHVKSPGHYYYSKLNIDWEEKSYDFSEATMKGVPYHAPLESHSAPVLHRNGKQLYCPTEQSCQRECRECQNRARRHEVRHYCTTSPGSSCDSSTLTTVYDDSYAREDYKKNIYDTTSELVQIRPKIPSVNRFDPDKNYEHFTFFGNRNYDDHNVDVSNSKEKELKSKTQRSPEYDAYSNNIEDTRKSVENRAETRNSIKAPNNLQNKSSDTLVNEEHPQSNVKSKAQRGSEYDAHSNNIEDIRKSGESRSGTRNSSKDTQDLQHSNSDSMVNEGQLHSDIKSKARRSSEYDVHDNNIKNIRKSVEDRSGTRNSVKDTQDLHHSPSDSRVLEGQLHSDIKPKARRSSEYESYSFNAEDIRGSVNGGVGARNSIKVLHNYKNISRDEYAQEQLLNKSKGANYRHSFSEGQGQRTNLKPLSENTSYNKGKRAMKPYSEYEEEENINFISTAPNERNLKRKSMIILNEPHYLRAYKVGLIDGDKEYQTMYRQEEEMQKMFFGKNGEETAERYFKETAEKQNGIYTNNKNSEENEKSIVMTNSEIGSLGSQDSTMATEYDKAYNYNIDDMTAAMQRHFYFKPGGENQIEFERNYDDSDYKQLFSRKKAGEINIIPSNKRSSFEKSEEGDRRSDTSMTTEYIDAYGPKIESESLLGDEDRYISKRGNTGQGQIVILNSNKESDDFVLGSELNESPLTSEYRDAYGAKYKYIVHQCSTNFHNQELLNKPDRNFEPNFIKLFSRGKVYEPKIIPLNNKTSDGQIELNMKSCTGNEIYSAYLYPDDSISKVWSLTDLNYEEFVVTVDDKVLHINVPLKNYNINGDVTLNISKRKPRFVIKEVGSFKPNTCCDKEDVDYSHDEENFSGMWDHEEGYSS